MPSSEEGMSILVRKGGVEIEEWLLLLEKRRELLKPHLDSITLPELGRLKCLQTESFQHDLQLDNPTIIGSEEFSLRTQGIFCVQMWKAIEHIPNSGFAGYPGACQCLDGVLRAWGLTRSGKWVLITIHFSGHAGYKDRGYEKAEILEIKEADLATILDATKLKPKTIWNELGRVAKGIVEQREHLLHQVRHLAMVVEMEELALSLTERENR